MTDRGTLPQKRRHWVEIKQPNKTVRRCRVTVTTEHQAAIQMYAACETGPCLQYHNTHQVNIYSFTLVNPNTALPAAAGGYQAPGILSAQIQMPWLSPKSHVFQALSPFPSCTPARTPSPEVEPALLHTCPINPTPQKQDSGIFMRLESPQAILESPQAISALDMSEEQATLDRCQKLATVKTRCPVAPDSTAPTLVRACWFLGRPRRLCLGPPLGTASLCSRPLLPDPPPTLGPSPPPSSLLLLLPSLSSDMSKSLP